MKKSILLLLLLTCLPFLHGQETIFFETCGKMDVSSPKKVDSYTGWDNSVPVRFSRTSTLDGCADVRITGTTTNHVWFPSGKSSDLIISDIGSANYQNLKLSFDIAAYKLAEANVNKLTVYCNDSMLALPSVTFASSKFISVTGIELRNSNAITLKFQYTAENNTNGYRLDNFRITGVRVTSAINNPSAFRFNPIVAGRNVILRDVADGTVVEIYDMLGSEVQASKLEGGLFVLNNSLSTGFYIIRIGQINGKIRL